MTLARYLKRVSKDICKANDCTNDNHKCESYAYIDKTGNLLDVCYPDYFQGSSKPYAAIFLPWNGSQRELMREVREQCAGMED